VSELEGHGARRFNKFVASNLRGKTWQRSTPRQIDEAVEYFMEAINRAVEESTPWASPRAKHLGIWLDKQLKFDTHRKKLLTKAAGSLEALRGISGSTWGAPLMSMCKIYQAVIIPQALWRYRPGTVLQHAQYQHGRWQNWSMSSRNSKTCGDSDQWRF
jgi:hypothetical protein